MSTEREAMRAFDGCVLGGLAELARIPEDHSGRIDREAVMACVASIRYGRDKWSAARKSALAREKAEPVAEIGACWTIRYCGGDAISDIVERHNLAIGTKLYTRPTAPAEANVAKAEIQEVIGQMTSQQWGGFESIPLRTICRWRDQLSRAIGEVPFDGIARDATRPPAQEAKQSSARKYEALLRADIRRCLDDVATEFRARGRDDHRFVQMITRMDAVWPKAARS